jgi:hypothetical protein
MQRLIYGEAPYRPMEGYWWADKRKLRVETEDELFRLLGARHAIAPNVRTVRTYQVFLGQPRWTTRLNYADVAELPPTQGKAMF